MSGFFYTAYRNVLRRLTTNEIDANFDGLYDGSANILPNSSGNLGQNAWGSYNFAPTWSASGAGSYFANAAAISAATSDASDSIVIGAAMPIALQARVDASGVTGGTVVLNVEAFDSSSVSLGVVCSLTVTNGSDNGKLTASGTTPANTASIKVNKGVSGSAVVSAAGLKFRRIKVEQGLYCGPWTDEASSAWLQTANVGNYPMNCQLNVTPSTTNSVTLSRYKGNKVWINGAVRTMTADLVYVASGLTADTIYYVYIYWTGTALAIEVSTTGYTLDSVTGMPLKTGDATRTLVGKIRASAATVLYGARTCSFWNRQTRVLAAAGNSTIGSSSELAIVSQGLMCWPDSLVKLSCYGNVASAGAGTWALAPRLDGVLFTNAQIVSVTGTASGQALGYCLTAEINGLTENALHTVGVGCWQSGGTVVSNPVYWAFCITFEG